jgi:RNA polymerase sigma-70 factor (ECF subfamily)
MDPTPPYVLALPLRAAPARVTSIANAERTIVERVQRGDLGAYRRLVDRHHRRVHAIVYRMVGSAADADDLAQQAFVSAYHAIAAFDPAQPFAAWVNRIAVNLAKDHLKSKRRTEAPLPDLDFTRAAAHLSSRLPDPELHAEEGERRRVLERALAALPEKDRQVLVMKDLEELSYEEMHGLLERPVTALKIRVIRARQRLRALLERWGANRD